MHARIRYGSGSENYKRPEIFKSIVYPYSIKFTFVYLCKAEALIFSTTFLVLVHWSPDLANRYAILAPKWFNTAALYDGILTPNILHIPTKKITKRC